MSLLNHLLKRVQNVEFTWTLKQSKVFEALKKALTSKPVIKIFNPKKEVILTTDASECTIAAVVSQEGHPIMYLSRKIQSEECNYSNIEKEALPIVWSVERAETFLLGKKFFLKSDHKHQEFLFNPRKKLPRVASTSVLRWSIKIMAFNFDIIYVKENTIPHVDALSRLKLKMERNMKIRRIESCNGWRRNTILQNAQQRNPIRPDTKWNT